MRILVADDSSQLVLLYRAALEDAGYEVVTATTGIAALTAAAASAPIDGAVLDVLMPGVSGDVTAERLLVDHPGLPVLLMTGDHGDQFVAGLPVPVLRKPFSPEELVRAVRELIERRAS